MARVNVLWFTLLLLGSLWTSITCVDFSDDEIVELFQKYLQINTTSGNDLTPAVEFWQSLAADEGVTVQVVEFEPGYPVLVIKWAGEDSSLRSIMLNSHMDVVPAQESDGWTYPPFDAYIDCDYTIWGRGTQDMKSVSIQYYAALRRLRANNVPLLRDVYMTLMPDEEIGAPYGMNKFLKSEQFANMRVGLELDEGAAYNNPYILLFYQDKVVWQIQVDCYGTAGHGSTFTAANDTAVGQCINVMNTLYAFREQEYNTYLEIGLMSPQVYTSLNLNKINAGTANNVVPGRATLVFDIRLKTTLNETLFEEQLREWISESGSNITLTFLQKDAQSPATRLTSDNPYWVTMQQAAKDANITLYPVIPTGSTDARFVRDAGYPAFGFSPMRNTETLLHSVNERLGVQTFLDGIDIYETIIKNLANIPASDTSENPSENIVYTNTGT